jgi:acyl-[acyl-carrier-protein]-phospholipid O-acyltransferase/long-chain-fatty-acid--[acyl-carrier-protein] ligase
MAERGSLPSYGCFGEALDPEAADIATVREELLKLGEFCFSQRPILQRHLGRACLRGLKRHPFRTATIDGSDHSSLSCSKLLGAAIATSRYLKKQCPEQRIGVVLPAGKGGIVTNLAIVFAGKVPVNLNFTSGRDSIESAKEQAGLKTIVTARVLVSRLPEFPWTPEVIHLDAILPAMKGMIVWWWLLAIILPSSLLARILGIPKLGDRAEATLLFTSGSGGNPKGVALTHRNVMANISQFGVMLDARKDDAILASLPFFHSFGCTVTLWYPLIEGVRSVSYPNPLEAGKIATVVERYLVTVMLATPTFLRTYLRKAEPAQLRSLRLLITGAEKLPDELAKAFHERFGKEVLQGYGLTETAPVVSVNLPDPVPSSPEQNVQPSNRPGSTGKLVPGLAAEIRDLDSDEKRSLHDKGMLWLKGPNVFEGYLNDPEKTADVIKNGWFKTGDIGRFDEDGFLYIEGRLSRFSKIGGEMVPHESVEQSIIRILLGGEQSERVFAVVGVSDALKGEALVLLSSIDVDLARLRSALANNGVPNLWIPRTVLRVEAIPVLASGKLDLAGCKALADERT